MSEHCSAREGGGRRGAPPPDSNSLAPLRLHVLESGFLNPFNPFNLSPTSAAQPPLNHLPLPSPN